MKILNLCRKNRLIEASLAMMALSLQVTHAQSQRDRFRIPSEQDLSHQVESKHAPSDKTDSIVSAPYELNSPQLDISINGSLINLSGRVAPNAIAQVQSAYSLEGPWVKRFTPSTTDGYFEANLVPRDVQEFFRIKQIPRPAIQHIPAVGDGTNGDLRDAVGSALGLQAVLAILQQRGAVERADTNTIVAKDRKDVPAGEWTDQTATWVRGCKGNGGKATVYELDGHQVVLCTIEFDHDYICENIDGLDEENCWNVFTRPDENKVGDNVLVPTQVYDSSIVDPSDDSIVTAPAVLVPPVGLKALSR